MRGRNGTRGRGAARFGLVLWQLGGGDATLPGCSGGELTHLDYWLTGLLKKVTNPDASFIEYIYDPHTASRKSATAR
jgi:hypothetical protein